MMQCFKKIRLNRRDKSQLKIEALVKERFSGQIVDQSVIDQEISCLIFDRNRKLIIDQVSGMSGATGHLYRLKM